MLTFLFIIFSFVFSSNGTVLTIEDQSYSLHDFFSFYPKKQWFRADSLQKEKAFNDFIDRKLCVFEANRLGLLDDPSSAVKLHDHSQQVLVNESYEYFVARPLIPKEDLDLARQNAKKEIFVNHILIGHSSSYLASPPKRSVNEALIIAQQIKEDYISGVSFSVLAEKYSDDPAVVENFGEVGWVSWGATTPAFQSAAFVLGLDDISSPVLTGFGYHLILVSDSRHSDYYYMEEDEYENLVVNITKNSIRDKLRPAAIEYDMQTIEDYGVVFNMDAIKKILDLYNYYQKEQGVGVSFLETMSFSDVVCVYDNKGYGAQWFARKLEKTPLSRRPKFVSEEDVLAVFKTYILQDIAIKRGLGAGVDSLFSYREKVRGLVSGLLYDAYLKFLLKNVSVPDSLSIRKYYDDNKYEKYIEDEKVTIREIKVVSRRLADSLLIEIESGASFSSIAKKHSLVNPVGGGIFGPFSRKQGRKYFDASSVLEIGGVSPVIASTNSTFSIIQLVEIFPSKPLGFDLVYARIESLLLKEAQDNSKIVGVNGLVDKYTVNRKTSLLY